jgi:GR25 family glycosyltransferase involved in LPS biosynthesis
MKFIKLLLSISILLLLYFVVFKKRTQPYKEGFQENLQGVHDVWYINLDRSSDRKKNVQDETLKLGQIPVNRWKAVDGSQLNDAEYDKLSIPAWSRPSYAKDEKKRKNELGCLLSHKSLLQNLEKVDAPAGAGHLILEDDIKIDEKTPIVWNKAFKTIGDDWDIVFFGLLGNKVKDVREGVGVPEWVSGAHAYLVKHSSLPKINDSLRIVYDPIDEMFARNPHGLRIFALSPSMITQDGSKSTIVP